jgi:outer membrane murein-binding lipoprotein Lpp
VTTLGVQVTTLEAQVTTLGVQVTTLEAQVTTLGVQVTTLEAQVTTLGVQVTRLEAFKGAANERLLREEVKRKYGEDFARRFTIHGLSGLARLVSICDSKNQISCTIRGIFPSTITPARQVICSVNKRLLTN